MRYRRSLQLLSVVCLGLATSLPAMAADDAKKSPTIKVIEAGREPKHELRYQFKKGAIENMAMDMEMSMKMSTGGQQMNAIELPVMKMTMKVETMDVMENGDAKLSMEFTGGDVAEKPGVPAAAIDQMRQQMKKMVGLRGTGLISSRGEAKEAKFDPPPGADPQLLQSLQNAEQQFSQMAAPLPKEAVGVGAKWEVGMDVNANGVKVSQTITYTLKEAADKSMSFDIIMKQSAPKQMVQGLQLEKLESTGSGSGKLDLSKIVPVDYSAKLDMDMQMTQGQNKIDMLMKMSVTMKPAE